jgi:3-oxoacyl-[acyl-carrier protein] reductase
MTILSSWRANFREHDHVNIGFDGKIVIVTGAAHGFGRAIAKGFAERGAAVHVLDVNKDGLAETVSLCGDKCAAHALDISDREAVLAEVEKIEKSAGRIDILVNNAGGVRGQVGRPLEEISAEDWQTIFDANLSGAFFLCQAVAPGMKRRKWGRIVNISSGAGLGISLTGIQAYASAKAGQIGLTRQLAHELGPFNITVNNVAPGFVRSNPTTERQWEAMGEAGQKRLLDNIALKRLGSPEDIAAMVMFFASDHAGWISGQVISVDGGK